MLEDAAPPSKTGAFRGGLWNLPVTFGWHAPFHDADQRLRQEVTEPLAAAVCWIPSTLAVFTGL